MSAEACRCWRHDHAIGHEGHCCFLVDDRAGKRMSEAWRADEDVCHVDEGREIVYGERR